MPVLFKSGIHVSTRKAYAENQKILEMSPPQKVYIPLIQHAGKPAKPEVLPGDWVKIGQRIAASDGDISADVFASVSGKVAEIADRATPFGKCAHIVIENGGTGARVLFPPLSETATPAELIARVRDAGVIGMGGAGFPTAFKLSSAGKIDTYIINGAECEPYVTCDHRIMLEHTGQFLRGALILQRAVSAAKLVVAVENNKPDAIRALREVIEREKFNITVSELKSLYPQGSEKHLIYHITGRKVAPGKFPSSVGVLVSNVHTALSTYLAVVAGEPLYRRVMTVSGGGIKNPSNLWVANGTLFTDVIEFCGGYSGQETIKLVNGGPMTGTALEHTDYASEKRMNLIALLTDDEAHRIQPMPCIKCGKCARACPMRLMPMYIDAYALAGDITQAVRYGLRECIRCGCCAYNCPAKRPIVQSIRLAKKKDDEKRGGQRK